MSKNESILIDLASNGRSDSFPNLQSKSSYQLQMAQLQSPRSKDTVESQSELAQDLFDSMEPHLVAHRGKNTPRSKL
ncbi:hypothetical protein BX616_005365, partial [Lobosporangium transversale]